MADIDCSGCGKKIPENARFCRYCGTRVAQASSSGGLFKKTVLTKQKEPIQEESDSNSVYSRDPVVPQEIPKSTAQVSSPAKPKDIPPVNPNEVLILYSRKRRDAIRHEKKRILEEMESLEEKFKIGLMDTSEFETKFDEADKKSEFLKLEEEKFVDGVLDVENYLKDYDAAKEKLKQLEDLKASGKIKSENVYQKLKSEHGTKLKEVEELLRKEKTKITVWMAELETSLPVIADEIEEVSAKKDMGEISSEERDVTIKELQFKRKTNELAAEGYKDILAKYPF